MSVEFPPLEGGAGGAPARRRRVRSALLASEIARRRAIREVRLAKLQALSGSAESKAWAQLLANLQGFDPWRS